MRAGCPPRDASGWPLSPTTMPDSPRDVSPRLLVPGSERGRSLIPKGSTGWERRLCRRSLRDWCALTGVRGRASARGEEATRPAGNPSRTTTCTRRTWPGACRANRDRACVRSGSRRTQGTGPRNGNQGCRHPRRNGCFSWPIFLEHGNLLSASRTGTQEIQPGPWSRMKGSGWLPWRVASMDRGSRREGRLIWTQPSY